MHSAAAAWDKANSKRPSQHVNENDFMIPVNRPCDWCGKPVEKGYIHEECHAKERAAWIDILY